MSIFALMVTRNEADRYLDLALAALTLSVDGVFVYDDQSTDNTVDVARSYGAWTTTRPDSVPQFLDHEGRFRQAAWNAFCETTVPEIGDWVLAVDADELVVADGDAKEILASNTDDGGAWNIRIPETFDLRDGVPYVRTDGYWGSIMGTRFFAFQPGGVFRDRPMASGSEPTFVPNTRRVLEKFWLLHLGYAKEEDRVAKYERYSTRTGHGDSHVASIIQPPTLRRWDGPSIALASTTPDDLSMGTST